MAYRYSKDIRDRATKKGSEHMVIKTGHSKGIYHYNLKSTTQAEFDHLVQLNKKAKVAVNPIRRSLGQLTPSNVLTIKGYYDVKGLNLMRLRNNVYRFAKEMNLHIETAFSRERAALLVRLKRDWPVGVDKTLSL